MIDTDTEYEHNLPYIRGIASKVLRRMKAACPGSCMELEDVVAELAVPYIKASRAYDPSRGVPFKPFLARGCYRHVNQWIEGEIEKSSGAHLSLDRQIEGEANLHDVLASDDPTQEEAFEERQQYERGMKLIEERLSPRAVQFAEILLDPPSDVLEAFRGVRARSEHARSSGYQSCTPSSITASFVADVMGATRSERTSIYREIRDLHRKIGH